MYQPPYRVCGEAAAIALPFKLVHGAEKPSFFYSLPGSSLVMPIGRLCLDFLPFSIIEAEPLDIGSQAGAWEPVNFLQTFVGWASRLPKMLFNPEQLSTWIIV
jgi:hypothetical protein